MVKIKELKAIEILDSRGNPTIFTEVYLDDGSVGNASVPSGASTGQHEAKELRDGDMARFNGKGVLKAVENVNTKINQLLKEEDPLNQKDIDQKMLDLDGTKNKEILGANAILSVSLAVSRASAKSLNLSLFKYLSSLYQSDGIWRESLISVESFKKVTPFLNIINGGRHADNNVDIQETMIVPQGKDFAESLRMATEVYQKLKETLHDKGLMTTVGDEGGFAPNLESNSMAMDVILEAIEKSGFVAGKDIFLALDVAASEIFHKDAEEKYVLSHEKVALTSRQLTALYEDWIKKYPIISIEDGMAEDDFSGWKELTERLGTKIQLVGDDLFVTNKERIKKGIEKGIANSVLIKPNQIGSLTETFEAIRLARENGYKIMISHRSGETEDDFIADLAVGVQAEQIKAGAPARGERVAKYNRLLEIEREIKLVN